MRAVSVVIPTRDTRELTLRCVASVLAASAWVRDVVVVDDGGTDDTAAALARLDPAITVLRNSSSLGFTRAANLGAAATMGGDQPRADDLLLFLNSDTELERDALRELVRAFTEDPRLGVAGAQLHYPDGSTQWSAGPTPSLTWLFAMASGAGALRRRLLGTARPRDAASAGSSTGPIAVDWVSGAAMAVRRKVWNEIGPFDERFFFYAQDLDLCLRARAAGWSVALLPAVPVLHHHGATVGRQAGAPIRQDQRLLWGDLLRWVEKERGPRSAARAARVLRAGARCRLFARALAVPFLPAGRRAELAADSRGIRLALAGEGAPAVREEPLD